MKWRGRCVLLLQSLNLPSPGWGGIDATAAMAGLKVTGEEVSTCRGVLFKRWQSPGPGATWKPQFLHPGKDGGTRQERCLPVIRKGRGKRCTTEARCIHLACRAWTREGGTLVTKEASQQRPAVTHVPRQQQYEADREISRGLCSVRGVFRRTILVSLSRTLLWMRGGSAYTTVSRMLSTEATM